MVLLFRNMIRRLSIFRFLSRKVCLSSYNNVNHNDVVITDICEESIKWDSKRVWFCTSGPKNSLTSLMAVPLSSLENVKILRFADPFYGAAFDYAHFHKKRYADDHTRLLVNAIAHRQSLLPTDVNDADVTVLTFEDVGDACIDMCSLPTKFQVDPESLRAGTTCLCICIQMNDYKRTPSVSTIIVCGTIELSQLRAQDYYVNPRALVKRVSPPPLWYRAHRLVTMKNQPPHTFSLYSHVTANANLSGGEIRRDKLFGLVKWRLGALLGLYTNAIHPLKEKKITEACARVRRRAWHRKTFEPHSASLKFMDEYSKLLTGAVLSLSMHMYPFGKQKMLRELREWYLLAEATIYKIRLSDLLENEEEFTRVILRQTSFASICSTLNIGMRGCDCKQLKNTVQHFPLSLNFLMDGHRVYFRNPMQLRSLFRSIVERFAVKRERNTHIGDAAMLLEEDEMEDDVNYWVTAQQVPELFEQLKFAWEQQSASFAEATEASDMDDRRIQCSAEIPVNTLDLFKELGLERSAGQYLTTIYYRWRSCAATQQRDGTLLSAHTDKLEAVARKEDGSFWLSEEHICDWYRRYHCLCGESFPLESIESNRVRRWVAEQARKSTRTENLRLSIHKPIQKGKGGKEKEEEGEEGEDDTTSIHDWPFDSCHRWPLTRLFEAPFEHVLEAVRTRDALLRDGTALFRWYDGYNLYAAKSTAKTRNVWKTYSLRSLRTLFSLVDGEETIFSELICKLHAEYSKSIHSFEASGIDDDDDENNKTRLSLKKLERFLPPCMSDMLRELKRKGHIKRVLRFPLNTNLFKVGYSLKDMEAYLRPQWNPVKWAEGKVLKELTSWEQEAKEYRRSGGKSAYAHGCAKLAEMGLCPFARAPNAKKRQKTTSTGTPCDRCTAHCKKKHYRHLSAAQVQRRFAFPITNPIGYIDMAKRPSIPYVKKKEKP